MDAHELMLRRSQYICVLALVNARFSIMKKQTPTKRRRKRFWIREYLKQREKYGQFHTLFSELRLSDREYFFRYIRMSPERFEHLLTLVAPYIEKKACRSRDPISPAERLVVTLRYLATGDSQQSQSFNFRMGKSTICHIIQETCIGIWNALSEVYLKSPSSSSDWEGIANEMFEEWNFPHCIGALDGKHVMIECPPNGGSKYFNYKGYHSIVLLAMCDANYCFTMVDVGSYGKDNDASIFNESDIGKGLANGLFDIPNPSEVDGHMLPYVIVGDDIFGLKPYLMKPYPGRGLTESRQVFNYRLSRCRRIIENTFGIYTVRWLIFRRPIKAKPEHVDIIIKACLCLHNYLMLTDNAYYAPQGFVDSKDNTGAIIEGDWRAKATEVGGGICPIQTRINRYSGDANEVREKFESYFNSKEGSVPWQLAHVRNCGNSYTEALYQSQINH